MKCDNCGQENTEESKFCNNCGNTLNSQPVIVQEPQTVNQPEASPETTSAASPEMSTSQTSVMKQEIRPSATPMIVFSIINIVCCGSFILGVIALVFALMSNSETNIQEVQRKLRISMILNIIGIVLGVILMIIGIIFFVVVFIYGNGEFAGYNYGELL